MTSFTPLADVTERDRATIGGKAYNCARLHQAGQPIPDGIVVPTDATEPDIRLMTSHPWFDLQPATARYAVRSSGLDEDGIAHSFAGIHDTRLNVSREEIAEAVMTCRRSAESAQAAAYRHARHLSGSGRIGVLVQRMVPARSSGVGFTINPVSGADELVINIAPGTGEALVGGQVDPDEFIVRKHDGGIASMRLGGDRSEPVLGDAAVTAIAHMLLAIERHFGAPQDVEFCHDGAQFWIVQSRPVTTNRPPDAGRAFPAIGGRPPGHDIEWTRANLAEVLPEQLAPQALYLYEDLLRAGENRYFGRLMGPESEFGPIVKSFHGRLYFNLSQLRRITGMAGAAFADTLRSMGHSEAIHPEDEVKRRPPLRDILRALPDLIRLTRYALQTRRVFEQHVTLTEQALARLGRDPETMSDEEISRSFDWWLGLVPESLTAVFVMSSVQFKEQIIRDACTAVAFSYDRLVYPQLAAGQRSVSTQQAYDLDALAETARHDPAVVAYLADNDGRFADFRAALAGTDFVAQFEAFLERYGHRGRYESDWSIPRLSEDPSPALFAIRGQLHGPPRDQRAVAARQQLEAADAWRAFEARLTRWQRWTMLRRVRSTLRGLKQQYLYREQVRSDLTRVLARIRKLHLALAGRFVARGWLDRRDDYFLLRLDEVQRAIADHRLGGALRDIALRRAAQLEQERALDMPLFMRESELPRLGPRRANPASADGDLTGLCVSAGMVEAEVVVMDDPSEFAAMKRGAILVTRATDPSWTPLFTLATGVVVEVGGMLSHASTIAREYGLPALANVRNATRILKTGQRVRLDASGGRITIL